MMVVDGRLLTSREALGKMPLRQLILYERRLWGYMRGNPPPANIVNMLNQIYQEVEWRASDPEQQGRLARMGKGSH